MMDDGATSMLEDEDEHRKRKQCGEGEQRVKKSRLPAGASGISPIQSVPISKQAQTRAHIAQRATEKREGTTAATGREGATQAEKNTKQKQKSVCSVKRWASETKRPIRYGARVETHQESLP